MLIDLTPLHLGLVDPARQQARVRQSVAGPKEQVRAAQLQAQRAVNARLIELYWSIGRTTFAARPPSPGQQGAPATRPLPCSTCVPTPWPGTARPRLCSHCLHN